MLRSTFYSFSTALSALSSSQRALDVTGQNIANVDTRGYTRQRLDLYSVSAPNQGLYTSRESHLVGQGVGITNISQARDPYLDVRFRRESAKLGEIDANLSVMEDMEGFFDAVQQKGLGSQIGDLTSQLHTLAANAGFKEFDSIVRSSAESLTKLFNQYSQQLQSVRTQEEFNLEEVTVPKVNDILKDIANLNKSIEESQLYGNNPLELMDQRNLLIDDLSNYMNISVTTTTKELSPGVVVDKVRVDFIGADGAPLTLVNGKTAAELSVTDGTKPDLSTPLDPNDRVADGTKRIILSDTFDHDLDATGKPDKSTYGPSNVLSDPPDPTVDPRDPFDLTSRIGNGAIKGALDAINKSGEFGTAGNAVDGTIDTNGSRGIGYYEKRMDRLAATFAETMNKANKALNPAFDEKLPEYDPSKPDDPATNPKGNTRLIERPLFASADGGPITAKNLVIHPDWINGTYGVTASTDPAGGSGASDNITKMIALFGQDVNFTLTDDPASANLFKGTFEEFFADTGNVLALNVKSQTTTLKNYISVVEGIYGMKDSVSGINMDEEGVNMLRFQKSYNAAARFMTTLDQALDTIINRMGTVGL